MSDSDLVRYSRAGDVFHYRWAARQCLKLLDFKTSLSYLTVECSSEPEHAGEAVIDVAEYYEHENPKLTEVVYCQLKHTITAQNDPFTISDLKKTIIGFAKRFSELSKSSSMNKPDTFKFKIVTNRPIGETIKRNIKSIGIGNLKDIKPKFIETITGYTKFDTKTLQQFCSIFAFNDLEGDFNDQKASLKFELAKLLAEVSNENIDTLTTFIQDNALPGREGFRITREEVLKRFGFSSINDLFPAPPEFESIKGFFKREQHDEILKLITGKDSHYIIHASGGVGKSVIARQIANSLPFGSDCVVYDCFGAGDYLNLSKSRHSFFSAFVQIANELALKGLCDPLLAKSTETAHFLMKAFLDRLSISVKSLTKITPDAQLLIIIDAADNAEMAAEEFNQTCFASSLLKEKLPDGCKLIALCRTERTEKLKPNSTVVKYKLKDFSPTETGLHLRIKFPTCADDEVFEFHQLTACNPRVQANALSLAANTIHDVLESLGTSPVTVDQQIEDMLLKSINNIKDKLAKNYKIQIDNICFGLANLYPLIPITVLAEAAEVDESNVRSFVADMGRAFMITDNFIQFRDEPTETWFRKTYAANSEQVIAYIKRLKPLSGKFSYIAETLPILLLKAGDYEELIDLALSDNYLPDNPIDKRNIRIFRLQFAFKAALKRKDYYRANKIALLAGEEVAGNKRQLDLLKQNTDLIYPLISSEKIQELAYRRVLKGNWSGSENVYSTALLSSVDDFKGEARSYLKSARNWIKIYYDDDGNKRYDKGEIADDDFMVLAIAFFNLDGAKRLVDFLIGCSPIEFLFNITSLFVKQLVDSSNFTAIDEIIALGSKNSYLVLAVVNELMSIGKFPLRKSLLPSLNALSSKKILIDSSDIHLKIAIISFCEACLHLDLSKDKINQILSQYVPSKVPEQIVEKFSRFERYLYFRGLSLKMSLDGETLSDIKKYIPDKFIKKKEDYEGSDIEDFNQVFYGLLPWYLARVKVLRGENPDLDLVDKESKKTRLKIYTNNDLMPHEVEELRSNILVLNHLSTLDEIKCQYDLLTDKNSKLWAEEYFKILRAANRLDHLQSIRSKLEKYCSKLIELFSDESSEKIAEYYILLARAVLPKNVENAKCYFADAIDAVSKFGDEVVERWEAISALAKHCCKNSNIDQETAYRYIRCAELIGNYAQNKHWDRNDAIATCTKLHPQTAIAAVSRWQDRDIGSFREQLMALGQQLLDDGIIQPSVVWSLSAFDKFNKNDDLTVSCIEKEASIVLKQHIFDKAVHKIRLTSGLEYDWQELIEVAERFNLKNEELDEIKAKQTQKVTAEKSKYPELDFYQRGADDINWDVVFLDFKPSDCKSLNDSLVKFKVIPNNRGTDAFWNELFNRTSEENGVVLLKAVVENESLNFYDITSVLLKFPEQWLDQRSIEKSIGNVFRTIGQRFASRLSNRYSMHAFFDYAKKFKNNETKEALENGIVDGLAEKNDSFDADTYFGFIRFGVKSISDKKALELLKISLSRLEKHIEEDFGDGKWSKLLQSPESSLEAFTGLIWAILGSPETDLRWQAVHCVRLIAESNNQDVIDCLIRWMENGDVGAFSFKKYPFYDLHAKQFLILALARVSIDNPRIVKKHSEVFAQLALNTEHILIQKYAAQIALLIEKSFNGTYSISTVSDMNKIGVSQISPKIIDHSSKFQSYGQEKDTATDAKMHFSWDISQYWFKPLGEVFGLSEKQIQIRANKIIQNNWNINLEDDYIRDPRQELWNSNRKSMDTHHSHGTFPKIDSYNFYISYHAILTVASQLLKEMPIRIVEGSDYIENLWTEWLNGYCLTRSDGQWLADRRDYVPLDRRSWVNTDKNDNWEVETTTEDFFTALVIEKNDKKWLNVRGGFKEVENQYSETVHVTSALVSPETSQSLMSALASCSDPYDYKLPDYLENNMEFDIDPFVLSGWLYREEGLYKRIDEADLNSGNIDFPPTSIGQTIMDKLKIHADPACRNWFTNEGNQLIAQCKIWNSSNSKDDEDKSRNGHIMSVSLDLLIKLCKETKCDMIFAVEINRRNKRYKDEEGFKSPKAKVYLLSAKGVLRDTETSYRLW